MSNLRKRAASTSMSAESLNLLHIDTERTWRGGQQQVFSLVMGLRERGHRNVVAVRARSPLAERLHEHGIETYETDTWGEANFIEAHFLNRFIKRERIHLVHAHSAHAVSLAALATLGTCVPFILTRRVDFPLSRNFLSKWKYGRAARLVAISQGVRKILLSGGISPENITLIPSGIDFERFKNVSPVSKEFLGVPNDFVLIGQVAALADHKDQATFLRALKWLTSKTSRFAVIILGEGKRRFPLEQLRDELGLKEKVQLLGHKDDYLRYLAACDLFCLSSKEEGLGTAVLEAMALQIPVVATRAGGIPEMVEEGVTGFLADPQNPASLAEALSRAIDNLPTNKELLHQALSKAKKFDISNTISSTESLYRQLL